MLRKVIIGILIISGTMVLLAVAYFISVLSAFGVFDKTYTPTELVKSYNDRKVEIQELKLYFKKIVPSNKFVEIEFDNDFELYRLGVSSIDSLGKPDYETMFLEWHLKINSKKVDSVIKTLGWTQKTLKNLKEKLDNADCIQIESGEPTKLGFKRSGMGMYFFNVFDKPFADSLITHYNDSCTYLFVNHQLVLEYGGGAVGAQCFFTK